MRCHKAREFCLKNRDGLLNEIDKMALEKHINSCPECAVYAKEMNCCLDLLCDLPELTPSENFEWNLKRAILQEKTRRVRLADSASIGEWRWGVRFVASAAAVAAIVLVGVWFASQSPSEMRINSTHTSSGSGAPSRSVRLTPRDYGIINFTSSGYQSTSRDSRGNPLSRSAYTQPLLVNGSGRAYATYPIQFATSSREDSLMVENQFLWRRMENLEREVMVLQRLLSQELTRRK